MLELREYSRKELFELYKSNTDLKDIKAKVKRQGYTFVNIGRGSNYKMLITSLPSSNDQFKEYCKSKLLFSPQTDFNTLKAFIYNLLVNDRFITLQFNEMTEVLKSQGINTKESTISKYYHHLVSIGMICETNNSYIYFYYDTQTESNKYISRKQYLSFYNSYWNTVRKNNNFDEANVLFYTFGGKPKKRRKPELNGIYNADYNELLNLIRQENF